MRVHPDISIAAQANFASSVMLRFTSLFLSFLRGVQEREHVFDHLPQAAVEREVVVHEVDEEVVVVDVLNDHARRRLVLVQLRPLLNPQRKSLVLWEQTELSYVWSLVYLFLSLAMFTSPYFNVHFEVLHEKRAMETPSFE